MLGHFSRLKDSDEVTAHIQSQTKRLHCAMKLIWLILSTLRYNIFITNRSRFIIPYIVSLQYKKLLKMIDPT